MNYKIMDIQGIGPDYAEKLKNVNINTTDDLLKFARDPKNFTTLAEKTGIGEASFVKWACMAGLMRVNGIGPQNAELLYFSGVETLEMLRDRPVDALLHKMTEVNTAKNLTNALPGASDVHKWQDNIKTMPEFAPTHVR